MKRILLACQQLGFPWDGMHRLIGEGYSVLNTLTHSGVLSMLDLNRDQAFDLGIVDLRLTAANNERTANLLPRWQVPTLLVLTPPEFSKQSAAATIPTANRVEQLPISPEYLLIVVNAMLSPIAHTPER